MHFHLDFSCEEYCSIASLQQNAPELLRLVLILKPLSSIQQSKLRYRLPSQKVLPYNVADSLHVCTLETIVDEINVATVSSEECFRPDRNR